MTAEKFFKKYIRDQEKLKELKYQLARLDDDVIRTTQLRQDKVQTSIQNKLDERIYDREGLRARLEHDIYWLEFDIRSFEMAMSQVGDRDGYRVTYLKRHYLDKHTISKIARDFGISTTKVKRIMKETEELLCYIAK